MTDMLDIRKYLLIQAGIKKENLIIALEPEAASLFCMHLPVDKMAIEGNMQQSMRISPFSKGTKYMVVDVGGKLNSQ